MIAYDIEKFAAEVMARNYQQNYGMEIVSLRFGTIYAPGKLARHGRMGLLAVMIENALAGMETSIPSGGDQVDDVMYVGDVARGITLSLFAAPELEPMYNIATGYEDHASTIRRGCARRYPRCRKSTSAQAWTTWVWGLITTRFPTSASPNVTLVMSLHTGSGRALKTTSLPLGGSGRSSHVRPTAGAASATAAVTPAPPAVVQGRLAD